MRKYLAELIGSFGIVLIGCGSMVAANFLIGAMGLYLPLGFTTLISALAFGIIYAVMYFTFNDISGSHFNPAVTFAVFMKDKEFKGKAVVGYIVAQVIGAVLAIITIWQITSQKTTLGQNGYGEVSPLYLTMWQTAIIEIILSFLFVLVFLTVKNKEAKENSNLALVVGSAFAAMYMLSIPCSGGSLNPARSFASSIVAFDDSLIMLPIFVILPFIGALLAVVVVKFIILGESLKKEANLDKIQLELDDTEQSEDIKTISESVSIENVEEKEDTILEEKNQTDELEEKDESEDNK